jgi:hypothetical protein
VAEGFGTGLARCDDVPSELRLHRGFDDAAEDDDPHGDVADLGAERGGGDQLA